METTNNNTQWTNLRSIATLKAEQAGQRIDIGTRKFKDREGSYFCFACGNVSGLVSEAAVAHLQGGGKVDDLVVGHAAYIGKNGKPGECDMLRMPGGAAPTEVLWTF